MPKARPRILIVEEEYLVGMDAERILIAAIEAAMVAVATPATMAAHLERETFDVAVIEIAASLTMTAARVAQARHAGAAIVFTSVFEEFGTGIAGWENIPVVLKPFDEKDLVAKVATVLTGLQQ